MKYRAKNTRKSIENKIRLPRVIKPYPEPFQRYYYSYQIEKITGTEELIFSVKRDLHVTGLVMPNQQNGAYKKQVKIQK